MKEIPNKLKHAIYFQVDLYPALQMVHSTVRAKDFERSLDFPRALKESDGPPRKI